MGVGQMIASNHAALAKFLFPASIAGGFFYSMTTGTSPLADAKSAALGTRSDRALLLQVVRA